MKNYHEYKNSEIEWIGEIPTHWNLKKIKHTTYVKGRIGWQGLRSDEFLEVGDSYVVTGTDFDQGKINWKTCYQITKERYDEDAYIQLKENDLLITKDGTIGKIALVKAIPTIATLNSGVFVTRPNTKDYITAYMFWVLQSNIFTSFINFNKSGSTILHLYQNVFNEFKFPCPPINEQLKISQYLDFKISEIDKLIAAKESSIALLIEERNCVINQSVTKGIKENVTLKNSDIEWVGVIPIHWASTRIKYLAIGQDTLFIDGDWIESNVIVDEGIRYITTGNIGIGNYKEQGTGHITQETFENLRCTEVFEGDLLISRLNVPIGRCCIIPNLGKRIVTSVDNVILRPNNSADVHYLKYLFSSKEYFEHTELIARGATMQRISRGLLGNIKIPLPPKDEQIAIANFLTVKIEDINSIIVIAENSIKVDKTQ